jgi:DNA-binding NtrC family response regulator
MSLTILLVEDDPDQREALADVLGDRHQITVATDAPNAIALVEADPGGFDLVITDLHMPGPSGLALLRALRDRGVLAPLVLMSSDHQVRQLALDEGFYDCLKKPLSFDLLDAILARVAADKARRVSTDALLTLATPPGSVAVPDATTSAAPDKPKS